MSGFSIQRDIPGIDPNVIFEIGNFPITSSTLTIILIGVVFIILGIVVARTFRLVPTNFQAIMEMVYDGIVGILDEVTNDKRRSQILFPIIGAMFVYLLVANLIGLLPGISEITVNGQQLFQTPTADFNTTFGLALASVIVINLISIREWGPLGFAGKFIKVKEVYQGFKKSAGEGALSLVDLFVGVLDIVGEIAKVISLSVRLFANMYAGQILAIILLGAFAYVVPSIWYAMNIFVGGLQAMVFAVLVAAYYMLAIKPAEEEVEVSS